MSLRQMSLRRHSLVQVVYPLCNAVVMVAGFLSWFCSPDLMIFSCCTTVSVHQPMSFAGTAEGAGVNQGGCYGNPDCGAALLADGNGSCMIVQAHSWLLLKAV